MAVLHDNADHSLNMSYGGWWGNAIFRPLHRAGPERDAVHIVFTTSSTADYQPTFADAAGFVQEMGGGPWPRLNHFVALSPDNVEAANAQAAQRFKDRLRSATQTYENDQDDQSSRDGRVHWQKLPTFRQQGHGKTDTQTQQQYYIPHVPASPSDSLSPVARVSPNLHTCTHTSYIYAFSSPHEFDPPAASHIVWSMTIPCVAFI